jgi:undecaprenyl-diphosphatase
MNIFDHAIEVFVSGHLIHSYYFSHIMEFIAEGDNMLKGGVFALLIWYMWFRFGDGDLEKRVLLLTTLAAVFFVMVITLGLAGLLPFRVRPLLNPDFGFSPGGPLEGFLRNMSSFPSDHAALFISLTTGFFFVSRKVGLFALIFTIVYILLPRLYLGFHYPTDLLSGSLIGASITWYFNKSQYIKQLVRKWFIPILLKYPGIFYAALFLVTNEISNLFSGSRDLISFVGHLVKHKL